MSETAVASSSLRIRELTGQVMKFVAVGGVGFLVDVGVFNLLLLHPASHAAWPMIAKSASTAVAIAVNWIGNRLWTFRDQRRADTAREGIEFLVASLVGSGVALLCLGVSHYVLGFTSTLADNISANVVGLILGSAVRFVAYRWWVFADRSDSAVAVVGNSTITEAPTPGVFSIRADPPARTASLATIASPSPPPE